MDEGSDEEKAETPELERPRITEEQLADAYVTMDDFLVACSTVQPSVRREGFTTVPDVTWESVGALAHVRAELESAIVLPILYPERFEQLGLAGGVGILLYGPPGNGKTLVAKAIANECGANFLSVKGPELYNKYVGESERGVRMVFERARAASPCVIFFDELDALAPRRSGGSSSQVTERVVNQLLTEMDGLGSRDAVYIVGATNRPDIIDPAMLRPGRFDHLLSVSIPDEAGRVDILRAATRKTPVAPDCDLAAVAADPRCDGFSGADLASLVREASMVALRESLSTDANVQRRLAEARSKGGDQSLAAQVAESMAPTTAEDEAAKARIEVRQAHFDDAFQRVFRSVSAKDIAGYERVRARLKGAGAAAAQIELDVDTLRDGLRKQPTTAAPSAPPPEEE